ncbi:CDP-glucose 4,6-dehydratase [Desulfovibrio sulfodismutans]|uniref:CDP-glucose 4,6-dehydratase n=1 Tax=Desulfolutivibrio sulfodismutans TaxID=63561 RepID=A0A7K3NPL6_9BACT|nr:CDP-glucose 4,6-dehydratase [Desulfolutivibrio sulfodismutans]NDY58146.1 CDP-glucose 4,6-dehydratase [Desulfolutivibrio sulfodismutans]QLA14640.1 CDP-glucose 4,6-dehydratase [Desulfolutivibrio sulfodismutans DSM 3696]
MEPDAAFWRGKRVVVTGHTGFKGGWLTLWLRRLGATVTGISLPPDTTPDLFTLARVAEGISHHLADIRDREAVARIIREADPQAVFHLAAQPLVRPSYDDPIGTFSTNVMGTAHVLDALRFCPNLRVVAAITTDKVYRNREWPFPYREDDHLGGHDPYSASKAGSEIVAACYRDAFFKDRGVALATARAGNVIGGGDWSLDRLIPDAVRAFGGGGTLHIRRPDAVRPWQHVLEPLAGYLRLARLLFDDPGLAGAYNFGPHTSEAATVRQVVELARAAFGGGEVAYGPGDEGPHEAGWLALETAKARTLLGVRPLWSLEEAVGRTMAWYARQLRGQDARELCLEEIAAYEALLQGAA